MAEVFGTVASALAVAELLAKSVSKVKRLWDEVQDVPDDIAWLIEQLGHYKLAVEAVEAALRRQDGVYPNNAADSAMQACHVAVNNLEALAVDLQGQITVARRSKRNVAKFKVSLKKDTIERHQRRLNFIFNMLSMSVNAQSLFQSTQIVHQNTQIITILQSRSPVTLLQNTEPVSQEVEEYALEDTGEEAKAASARQYILQFTGSDRRRRRTRAIPWKGESFFGEFAYCASSHPEHPDDRVYQARFQLPWWISRATWDFQAYRSCVTMGFSLTTWTTQPDVHPIFGLVATGSCSDITSYVSDNRDSMWFRNTDGKTLVDIAIDYGRLDVIKQLISMGLSLEDPNCVNPNPPSVRPLPNREETLDLFRLLVSAGHFDEYLTCVYGSPREFLLRVHFWNVHGLAELIIAENFGNTSEYVRLPINIRFKAMFWCDINPGILLHFIRKLEHISPLAFRSTVMGKSTQWHTRPELHAFCKAFMLGSSRCRCQDSRKCTSREEILLWEDLARWVLTEISIAELESHSSIVWWRNLMATVLIAGLFGFATQDRQLRTRTIMKACCLLQALRRWLEIIQASGIDLEEYGKQELGHFYANRKLRSYRWGVSVQGFDEHAYFATRSGPRLKHIVCGPRPEDWQLIWDPAVDEFAGEFWDLVENPPLKIPGAWVY